MSSDSLIEKGNVGGNRGGLTRSYSSTRTVTWDPRNKGTTTKTRETSSSSKSNSVKSTGAYRVRPFRRLSDAEFQERTEARKGFNHLKRKVQEKRLIT